MGWKTGIWDISKGEHCSAVGIHGIGDPPGLQHHHTVSTSVTDTINKVEKGTQGIDGRVYNPRNKQEQVFVITLSRMGEDANFALRDIDSTFAGFAGADYDLQV